MIMKKTLTFLCLTLTLLTNGCAFGQTNVWTHPWMATIKVIDEGSQPVTGATVAVWYYVKPPAGENEAGESVQGLTDTNGIVRLSHAATGSISLAFDASKVGYYSTTIGHEFAKFADNDPQKWNPSKTLLLKNIGKPIAMYAKKYVLGFKLPEYNKKIGYDLMIGDWIGPYGKGINSDIFFTENHLDEKSGYTFTVSFPNPGDGIQGFTRDWNLGVSGLLSSHEAPLDGYQPKYEQAQMPNPDRIYYFRVRTKIDDRGNIVSAHYGKIYGDVPQFTYYFNPTPNDRNIEFDPKQNLLQGLQSFEQVRQP
jgi:hypothetical protein